MDPSIGASPIKHVLVAFDILSSLKNYKELSNGQGTLVPGSPSRPEHGPRHLGLGPRLQHLGPVAHGLGT